MVLIAGNINIDQQSLRYLIYGVVSIIVTFWIAFYTIKKLGKDPRNILPVNFAKRIQMIVEGTPSSCHGSSSNGEPGLFLPVRTCTR